MLSCSEDHGSANAPERAYASRGAPQLFAARAAHGPCNPHKRQGAVQPTAWDERLLPEQDNLADGVPTTHRQGSLEFDTVSPWDRLAHSFCKCTAAESRHALLQATPCLHLDRRIRIHMLRDLIRAPCERSRPCLGQR